LPSTNLLSAKLANKFKFEPAQKHFSASSEADETSKQIKFAGLLCNKNKSVKPMFNVSYRYFQEEVSTNINYFRKSITKHQGTNQDNVILHFQLKSLFNIYFNV